jgi:hypothetical protein
VSATYRVERVLTAHARQANCAERAAGVNFGCNDRVHVWKYAVINNDTGRTYCTKGYKSQAVAQAKRLTKRAALKEAK